MHHRGTQFFTVKREQTVWLPVGRNSSTQQVYVEIRQIIVKYRTDI